MTGRRPTAKSLTLAWLKEKEVAARNSKVGLNFEYDGWNFLLWHDADDPSFYRLTLPGICDVDDDHYAQALMACNTINWNLKMVKASLYEYEEAGKRHASVWVCFERWVDTTDARLNELLPQAVTALIQAAERFQVLLEN